MIKHKWWTIGTAAFLVVLIGLYLFGKNMTNESRYINQLEAAFQQGDSSRVAALLVTDDEKVTMDESKAKSFIAFVKQQNLLADMVRDLNDQAGGADRTPESLIVLENDGKRYGIYNRYRFVLPTSSVTVHTNYDRAVIKLDGKPVATADSTDYTTKIGPMVPGLYALEAEFVGDYTTLKASADLQLHPGSHEGLADLSMSGAMVTVDANYAGAKIFIDDKDTGFVTGGNDSLGPITIMGANRVRVENTFPWGTVSSGSVPIDDIAVHLEIDPLTDKLKDSVILTTSEFLQSWMQAYNSLDPGVAKHLSKEQQTQLISNIDSYKTGETTYEGKLEKVVFDRDSFHFQDVGGGVYRIAVTLENTYTQISYNKGDAPPAPTEHKDVLTYDLQYENGEWVVTNWYTGYASLGENTTEMTFEQI